MQLQAKKTVRQTANSLPPTSFTTLKFLTTLTMSIKSIQVQLQLSFKERYNNHTRDFRHKKYMKCNELSKYIWNLKNQGITPIIKWRIVKKVNGKVSRNYCTLCLTKKFFIINFLDDCNLLNKRSELISKRRHQNKLLLSNVKGNDSMD